MGSAAGVPRRPVTAPSGFPSWISYFPGDGPAESGGAIVVFPHAGASAANYRMLATSLADTHDTFIVQYPQRANRWREPGAAGLPELAADLFAAAAWDRVGPLQLFGHSMGSLVAFEFARIAEQRDVAVPRLWVSAGPAPSTVGGSRELPTDHATLLADLTELGGTDARLLADDEFARILTGTLAADYRALNRYRCAAGVTIGADIHVIGGQQDRRVTADALRGWAGHTTGEFTLSFFDGGHFYLYDHLDTLAARITADA